ncbi:hypothetical protein LLEC1_06519 [Akanthomyces lecanii]|uniref:Uncharacterized protein n=1 Tax=Cordyceps confragosa TaxID=2714763 RepID=A0A179ILD8_CORDF|nr:hypothetical protein LLEC1_06519 [Akanthomyces lecanii]
MRMRVDALYRLRGAPSDLPRLPEQTVLTLLTGNYGFTRYLAIAETRHADKMVVFRFTCLAQTLGFSTYKITALVQRSPDHAITYRLLTTA